MGPTELRRVVGRVADDDIKVDTLALQSNETFSRYYADADEPLYVYADRAGHPFCVFVADD